MIHCRTSFLTQATNVKKEKPQQNRLKESLHITPTTHYSHMQQILTTPLQLISKKDAGVIFFILVRNISRINTVHASSNSEDPSQPAIFTHPATALNISLYNPSDPCVSCVNSKGSGQTAQICWLEPLLVASALSSIVR